MPNWCVGDLKVRGKASNIESFFKEALPAFEVKIERCDSGAHDIEWKINKEFSKPSPFFSPHIIQGTRRQIIQQDSGEACSRDDLLTLVFNDLECAWTFDVDGFAELSKKHGIDFRFYGFEQGMQFNQEVEIIQGEVTSYKEHKFDDYEWECIRPTTGG